MCAKAKEDKAAKKAKVKKAPKAPKASKGKPKKRDTGANEYNFFLLHGEVIILAVGVLLFVALVGMGGGLDKFTLTASQINESSTRAEDNIRNSDISPKEFDESIIVFEYDKYSELIKDSVKVTAYETGVRWEQSLFPDKVKRRTSSLFRSST